MSKKHHSPTPHDLFSKANLENKETAKQLICQYFSKEILKRINFESLKAQPTEFIKHDLRKVATDVLYSVKVDNKNAYIYLLLEHQSTADEMMAFRILLYSVQIMQWHLKQGHKKLPLILPAVLYHGNQSPYPYSTSIYDCFEDKSLAKGYAFENFNLIDLTIIDDEVIAQEDITLFFQYLLKHSRQKDFTEQLIQFLKQHPDRAGFFLYGGIEWINQVLSYIETLKDSDPYKVESLLDVINQNTNGEFMTIIEKWKDQSYNQGIHQGVQQGINQEKFTIAKNLIKLGLSDEKIIEATNIDKKTLNELKQQ
ncbi:Rpn family recombination-promoting nuclease/putative transposase [Francisellaceae bacterium]|nr:Rpn family recombination-promoting nuclease/putative transposase [Francisellaceae bacterium]